MAADLHDLDEYRQRRRVDLTHGPAQGVVVGMLIGLAFWAGVILLALVIASV